MVAQKYNQAKLPLSRKRKVLIGAVIVIVIGVVLRMAGPIAQKQILRHTLDKEVAAALAAEYADIDQKLDDRIARMQQILDLPENSMYTVTYDSCYQDSSDTGWMALNYNHNCAISRYAFFEVSEGSATAHSIDKYAAHSEEIGSSADRYYGRLHYMNKYEMHTEGLLGTVKDLPYTLPVVMPHTYTSAGEVMAVQAVAYASSDVIANRHVREERGRSVLESQKTYLVIGRSDHYFIKNIGCRVFTFFCQSPL
jgi:hypothetical protein